MKTKTEILKDIKNALESINEEILCYGYTLDITTKTDKLYIKKLWNNYR